MRTDTATFRSRVFGQVRALGVNHARSRVVARRIASGIAHGSYSSYSENAFAARREITTLDLELVFCFGGQHVVEVRVDGEFAFTASTGNLVLVNVNPTIEQIALKPLLEDAMTALSGVIGDECQAWDAANGHPADWTAADTRAKAVDATPAVAAARAAYEALRDRSLAINPFAPIGYIDPALWSSYSDDHKSENGFRPRGYIRYDEARRFYERLDAANGNEHIEQAA